MSAVARHNLAGVFEEQTEEARGLGLEHTALAAAEEDGGIGIELVQPELNPRPGHRPIIGSDSE
jgi:hypothetical protein